MEFQHESNKIYLSKENTVIAEVTFPNVTETMVNINHTFVDQTLRGQGIASKLMDEAVEEIRKQNKKAQVTCSYAVKWFDNHPEHKDILA